MAALLCSALLLLCAAGSPQPQCTMVQGYDLYGHDLLGPDGKPAPQPCPGGPAACCAMCSAKDPAEEPKGTCGAWSFNHGTSTCWMKTQKGSHLVPNGDTSGYLPLMPPARTHMRLNTGQLMPFINLGGTSQAVRAGNHYSNYSEFLRIGGRGLDTALGYTDPINRQIAAAIKAHPEIAREELFVTSKLPPAEIDTKNPEMNGTASQDMAKNNKLLGLEYTDLTLLHAPVSVGGKQSVEATVQRWVELEAGLAAGLTKAIGVSNFGHELLAALMKDPRTKVVPAVNQCNHAIANHNSSHAPLFGGDDATVKFCAAHGISYSAYSPLEGLHGGSVMKIPEVIAIGAAHNVSAAQVAFRWLIQQNITAVTAAHVPEYIAEDVDVFHFELTAEEMATLTAI